MNKNKAVDKNLSNFFDDNMINYELSSAESGKIMMLKLLLSVLVVYVHSYATEIKLTSGNVNFITPVWLENLKFVFSHCVAASAVPGFFVLASILLYRKDFDYVKNIRKKIKTLLIPYVLLNTFWIFAFWFGQMLPKFGVYFANPENIVANWGIYGWLKAYGLVDPGKLPMLYPLWFVRNLFVLNIVAVAIKKAIDCAPKIGLLVVAVMLLVPTGLDGYTTGSLIFWILGYYIVKYNVRDSCLNGRKATVLLMYLFCLVCDFFAKGSIVGYGVHMLTCGVGILAFYVLGELLLEGRYADILKYLSTFSITIYFFHEMSLGILRKICGRIFVHTTFVQFMEYIFIPIVITAWCIVLSLVLRRYCPKIYGVVTGNRGW